MPFSRSTLLSVGLLLAALCVSAWSPPAQARRAASVATQGYRQLFYAPGPARARRSLEPKFRSWKERLVLDDEEEIQRYIRFVLEPGKGGELPAEIPVTVMDAAQGDVCEVAEGDNPAIGVRVEPMAVGFNHLSRPVLCIAVPVAGKWASEVVEGHVLVSRPRVVRMEDRFALWLPVQPLFARAQKLEFEAELSLAEPIELRTSRWQVDLARKTLPDNRMRLSFSLERVAALPMGEGVEGIAGRVPAIEVGPRVSWDDIALEHRSWWAATARLQGSVVPLAARVLAQPDLLASVREAAAIALDETALDDSGGRGGTWLLPERATTTADAGSGTAASRAALLLALLRAADIRASPIFVSRSGRRVSPSGKVLFLNQVLVLVQDLSLRGDGQPLFIDPSRGSSWLGALDESLLGRDAFLLSSEGARWLRLPEEPPRRHWTLNVRETPEGVFEVSVEALLEGAPAARVRQWWVGGHLDAQLPVRDLAWLGGAWRGLLELDAVEAAGGRIELRAAGSLGRDQVLERGSLVAPLLPEVAAPGPFRATWPYSRDARPFDISLLESWTFASRRSGGAMPDGDRVTPFWEVEALGRWSGPLFKRRSRIRFVGRSLARDAAVEVERFQAFTGALLGGVSAP